MHSNIQTVPPLPGLKPLSSPPLWPDWDSEAGSEGLAVCWVSFLFLSSLLPHWLLLQWQGRVEELKSSSLTGKISDCDLAFVLSGLATFKSWPFLSGGICGFFGNSPLLEVSHLHRFLLTLPLLRPHSCPSFCMVHFHPVATEIASPFDRSPLEILLRWLKTNYFPGGLHITHRKCAPLSSIPSASW